MRRAGLYLIWIFYNPPRRDGRPKGDMAVLVVRDGVTQYKFHIHYRPYINVKKERESIGDCYKPWTE